MTQIFPRIKVALGALFLFLSVSVTFFDTTMSSLRSGKDEYDTAVPVPDSAPQQRTMEMSDEWQDSAKESKLLLEEVASLRSEIESPRSVDASAPNHSIRAVPPVSSPAE